MRVTLTLDSGCFLPSEQSYREVGCYQSAGAKSDLRVYVDGEEADTREPLKVGTGNALVELRHTAADGEVIRNRVLESSNLAASLASLKQLYGEDVEVDRAAFDCVLRIESGHLRPSIVKERAFMETEEHADGTMKPTGNWKALPNVAHGLIVHVELSAGDNWEIVSGGRSLVSVKALAPTLSLDVEWATDDETGIRVYRDGFKQKRRIYWFPDGCNEEPSGPYLPCQAG